MLLVKLPFGSIALLFLLPQTLLISKHDTGGKIIKMLITAVKMITRVLRSLVIGEGDVIGISVIGKESFPGILVTVLTLSLTLIDGENVGMGKLSHSVLKSVFV